jgi:3-isopropylmalate dehydrogenase
VIAEGVRLLEALKRARGLPLDLAHFDYGADRYLRDGVTLPREQLEEFRAGYRAILFGAVGDPRVPDGRHAREILLALRTELDLYVNFRPVRLLAPRLTPLAGRTRDDLDLAIFRENTEGIYVDVGGTVRKGTKDEVAINEMVNTRLGVERICRAGLEHARANGIRTVWMCDKSNAIRFAHGLWQRVWAELAREYADLELKHAYVDAMVMYLVQDPARFRVIVTSNLFGDILSDLGAALTGGLGFAASANVHPGRFGLYEPVHGSAPHLAGRGVANPLAACLSVALLLRDLGHGPEGRAVDAAVEAAVAADVLTPDAGGTRSTREVADFVIERALALLS